MPDWIAVLQGGGLLAFSAAVLADLRLLRRAYQQQALKVAVIEARMGIRQGPMLPTEP